MLYLSGVASEILVINIFLSVAKPITLAAEDEEDEYETEFDDIRDPNVDVMYLVKKGQISFRRSDSNLK